MSFTLTMRARLDLLAIACIFVAYAVTIGVALRTDLVGSLVGGLANTVPVVLFGALARHVIQRQLIGRPLHVQLGAHLVLCTLFSACAYLLLIVLLAFTFGRRPAGFFIAPFPDGGAAWQTLENVTTYALIVTCSYLQAVRPGHLQETAAEILPVDPGTDAQPPRLPDGEASSRYFVRIGEELRPLDMATVVSIGGADDYTEVFTLSGRHLVRVTLAEFTRSLDPEIYVRVHRSWIVNVHRVMRAEPAGSGRLHLHLETGQVVSTSRTGAQLLRHRVI